MAVDKKKKIKKKTDGGKHKERKRIRLKHPVRFLLIMYSLILAALIGIVYFFPWLSNQMADVMMVEYGDLNSSRKQTFYFVKYETVFLADRNGHAGYSYSEGSMVRTGADVIKLQRARVTDSTAYDLFNTRVSSFLSGNYLLTQMDPQEREYLISKLKKKSRKTESRVEKLQLKMAVAGLEKSETGEAGEEQELLEKIRTIGLSEDYQADSSGVISYKVDGFEAALSPYTMKYLDREKAGKIENTSIDLFDGTVTKGEPICKLVNNREWYAVTWVDHGEAKNYKKGHAVTLKLDDGDLPGTVHKVVRQNGVNLVILRFDSFNKNVATLRKETCKIVTSEERGLIVRKSFIKKKDGQKGVYLIDVTGETVFTPVKVIAEDGAYVLVEAGTFTENGDTYNTINVYDEIKKVK